MTLATKSRMTESKTVFTSTKTHPTETLKKARKMTRALATTIPKYMQVTTKSHMTESKTVFTSTMIHQTETLKKARKMLMPRCT